MQGAGPLERPEDEEDDMTQEGPDMSRLFFPFLWKCYAKFWDNQDAYPEELGELEAQFRKSSSHDRKFFDWRAAHHSCD